MAFFIYSNLENNFGKLLVMTSCRALTEIKDGSLLHWHRRSGTQ